MNVITLNAEKGGVGKTTLAVHVAAGLAARGQRVLLVDADPQGHATMSLGMAAEPGLYNLLVRNHEIADVVRPLRDNLFVLPGNIETRAITQFDVDADALREALEMLINIDTVIIDTAPTPGLFMTIIYAATQYVIVPTQCETLALNGMMMTIQRAQRAGAQVLGIAPNLYQKATELHRYNLTTLLRAAQDQGWRVWPPIALATAWREASQAHQTVFDVYPRSKAAADGWRLVDKVSEALSYAG